MTETTSPTFEAAAAPASVAALIPHSMPIIGIFDRDEDRILRDVTTAGAPFKSWGHNVYSLAIPVPSHREETPSVCIELYYQDSEIKRPSPGGRRLFLSSEFHPQSGKHLSDDTLNCSDRNKFGRDRLSIIDNNVFNDEHGDIALPKNHFADYVLNSAPGFDDFSFAEFGKIFEVVSAIVAESPRST